MAIARNIAKGALFSTHEPLIPSPVPQICQLASCLCTATPEAFPGLDLLLGISKVLPASIDQRIPHLKPAEGTRWLHVRVHLVLNTTQPNVSGLWSGKTLSHASMSHRIQPSLLVWLR